MGRTVIPLKAPASDGQGSGAEAVLNAIAAAVVVIDAGGVISRVNTAAE